MFLVSVCSTVYLACIETVNFTMIRKRIYQYQG